MNNNLDDMLNFDPIDTMEKMAGGKHWSEFNECEQIMALMTVLQHNQNKSSILQKNNDTHHSMGWNEFINLIEKNGFQCGLKYDINHDENEIDEAVIYFRIDGLIIWATSYWNKEKVNGGTLYGEITFENWTNSLSNALYGCSNGTFSDNKNIMYFSKDIREGLFHTLKKISSVAKFNSVWTNKDTFLWFVDYAEDDEPNYNYEKITKTKIQNLPKQAKKIINR